ncbi:transmembrane protein 223 [Esox lucius]|uniref:Transmembrane protein 223 n=1 Tax=Esox lucius TaxID=8010 RepID=A0A3P8YGY2_ESOLU|nr:transmembrane protein 223 [Esox lucius]
MGLQHLFGGISECWSSLACQQLSNVLRLPNISKVTPRLSHALSQRPTRSSMCTGINNSKLSSRIRAAYTKEREWVIWASDKSCFGLLSSTRSRANVQRRYFHDHLIKETRQKVPHLRSLSTSATVAKDVILFEHDRTKFFRLLAIFGGGQFIFWTYLAHFAFTGLRDTTEKGSEGRKVSTTGLAGLWSFDMNLGSNAWRYGFTVACLVIGGGIMGLSALFCRRSVSQVILHKGGRMVTVSTQSPLGPDKGWRMTVPLSQVACYSHRQETPNFIPLRVKGYKFFFLLDKEGKLNNPKLFDITVGAYRSF